MRRRGTRRLWHSSASCNQDKCPVLGAHVPPIFTVLVLQLVTDRGGHEQL